MHYQNEKLSTMGKKNPTRWLFIFSKRWPIFLLFQVWVKPFVCFKKTHKTHASVSNPKGGFLGQLGNTILTASVAFPAFTGTNLTLFQELHARPVLFCLHDINLAPEATSS